MTYEAVCKMIKIFITKHYLCRCLHLAPMGNQSRSQTLGGIQQGEWPLIGGCQRRYIGATDEDRVNPGCRIGCEEIVPEPMGLR